MKRNLTTVVFLVASLLLLASISNAGPFSSFIGKDILLDIDILGVRNLDDALVITRFQIKHDFKNYKALFDSLEPDDTRTIKKGTRYTIVEEPIKMVEEITEEYTNGIVRIRIPDGSLWYVRW